MAGVNKVIIVGRLGANPELRHTPTGSTVSQFSVATSESWNDKQGQKQERTEWHRVVVWGKLAEICSQHLSKGKQVYVEGRLQTRSWDDKTSGQKRYATEVVANTVQFLGSANQGSSTTAHDTSDNQKHSEGSDFVPEPAFDSETEIPF